MRKHKAQVAIEFVTFVGIAVVLLMVFLGISSYYLKLSYERENVQTAEDLARLVKNEVNIASFVENGYSRNVDLPAKLKGEDYSILIGKIGASEKREIVINFVGLEVLEQLATDIPNGIQFTTAELKTGIRLQKIADEVQISKL
ncbi:hypothetical protein HY500_00060 [Candidatus Woesearchaeota archaeon]|nr:hypothetical protein [Candidatus Woesearchaeota archaeon]